MAEEIRRDPVTGGTVVVKRGGSGLWIVLLLIVALAALAYFTGLLNVGGKFAPPTVSVSGGEMPTVTTGAIVTGTTQQTVNVPKVETQKQTIEVPTLGVKKALPAGN